MVLVMERILILADETQQYSNKCESFINCYADQTNIISVSSPCFINDTVNIPLIAKRINPDIKAEVHTRTLKLNNIEKFLHYDKIVLSIDEDFFEKCPISTQSYISQNQEKIRFSIVATSYNFGDIIDECGLLNKLVKAFPNTQIDIEPEPHEAEHIINCLSSAGTWIEQNNGSEYLEENSNIWLWNNKDVDISTLCLFGDGKIKSQRNAL